MLFLGRLDSLRNSITELGTPHSRDIPLHLRGLKKSLIGTLGGGNWVWWGEKSQLANFPSTRGNSGLIANNLIASVVCCLLFFWINWERNGNLRKIEWFSPEKKEIPWFPPSQPRPPAPGPGGHCPKWNNWNKSDKERLSHMPAYWEENRP